jgi:hypothetical protein
MYAYGWSRKLGVRVNLADASAEHRRGRVPRCRRLALAEPPPGFALQLRRTPRHRSAAEDRTDVLGREFSLSALNDGTV